jgi:hypothetical protein
MSQHSQFLPAEALGCACAAGLAAIRAAGKRGYRYRQLRADLGDLRVEVSAEQWDVSAERWDNRLAVPNTCLLCTLDFLHAR